MVNNGFTRKKVGSMTLGEKLVKLRSDGRISLAEVSKSTKIQVKYLEYLEAGKYEKLPAEVYVKGFLRSYANYLGIPDKVLIRLYDCDRGIRKNICKEEKKEEPIKPIKFSRFLVTPKILAIIGSVMVMVLIVIYFYREVSSFLSEPYLSIITPTNGQVIEGNEVEVKGEVDKGSEVRINDQLAFANEAGEFSEKLTLQPGSNTVTICAKNKLDKITTKSITVQSDFEINDDSGNGLPEKVEKIKLEIVVVSAPAWVSVKADEAIVFSGNIDPDDVKEFEADKKFTVETDKGNNVLVKFNGEDRGRLSEKREPVKEAIFEK